MITVKQYAEERSITIQAVHQSMNGKRKKERLEGHVQIIDGVKWLDEEAVAILDEARSKSPIVYEKADANERIEEYERNEKIMLAKIATQADRISELAQWKADNALAIAEASQTQLLLDNTRAELAQVREAKETQERDFTRKLEETRTQAWDEAQKELGETAAQAIAEATKRLEDENHLLRQEVAQLRKHPLKGFIKAFFAGNKD